MATRGKSKLRPFDALLGDWVAQADSALGKVRCTRRFERVLNGKYLQLTARWKSTSVDYEEIALIGADRDGELTFWSFTSDGKQSRGTLADVTDVHPQAFGFEADMPAGRARMIYWPDNEGGFFWAVEARNKSGWRRFVEHRYRREPT